MLRQEKVKVNLSTIQGRSQRRARGHVHPPKSLSKLALLRLIGTQRSGTVRVERIAELATQTDRTVSTRVHTKSTPHAHAIVDHGNNPPCMHVRGRPGHR